MYFAHVIHSLVLLQIVAANPVSYLKPLSPENGWNCSSREFAPTCLYLRERVPSDEDYVSITASETLGCLSWIGRAGGRQELNLAPSGCLWSEVIAHEMLHAAGFYHQQSATERDDYVNILWENVQSDVEYHFDKMGSNSFGEKYDYGSIMHYSSTAFSQNGQRTIQTKDPAWTDWIGKALHLSEIDIRKVNKMYNCY